jgi:ParB/RepB/Spo0J family partition protein
MSTATATRSTRKTDTEENVLSLSITDITLDPDLQVRADPVPSNGNGETGTTQLDSALKALVDDIKENGQLTPVCVFQKAVGSSHEAYYLVDGHRRLHALQALNRRHITAIVANIREKDALKYAFSMNHCRKSLTGLDVARAIVLARKQGWTKSEIRSAFSLKDSQLKRYGLLMKSPDPVKEAVSKRDISMAQALAVMEASEQKESAPVTEIVKDVTLNKLSAGKIRKKYGSQEKRGRPAEVKPIFTRKDDALVFRNFKVTPKNDASYLKRMKAELEKGLAAIEKLLKAVK